MTDHEEKELAASPQRRSYHRWIWAVGVVSLAGVLVLPARMSVMLAVAWILAWYLSLE